MSTVFQVEKMSCNHCARAVTKAVQSVQPNAEVKVDLASGRVEVSPDLPQPAAVAKAIEDAGYPARQA